MLQNTIVEAVLAPAVWFNYNNHMQSTSSINDPWLLITAGPIGAGKSFVVKWLQRERHISSRHILIDIDQIRDLLPESAIMKWKYPLEYGVRTQKEAGLICEICLHTALSMRLNVILDLSMANRGWHLRNILKLRQLYAPMVVVLLHVTTSIAKVRERALQRAEDTRRFIPEEVLLKSLEVFHPSYTIHEFSSFPYSRCAKAGRLYAVSGIQRCSGPHVEC